MVGLLTCCTMFEVRREVEGDARISERVSSRDLLEAVIITIFTAIRYGQYGSHYRAVNTSGSRLTVRYMARRTTGL